MHPAHHAFREWLRGKSSALIGQVWVAVGTEYELRHELDREKPPGKLQSFTDPLAARQIATLTQDGKFRPLRSAPNLRRGWRINGLNFEGLMTALDCLYPAAIR